MASSGEVVTFRQFEAAANQMAHLYRATGLEASRPRRALLREQPAHARVRGRRGALRHLLHVHQLVPRARRGGVHHQRQRGAHRRDVSREARGRDAAARAVPERRAVAHGRHRQRRRALREPLGCSRGVPHRSDRRRAARRGDALLVRHDRTAEGHPACTARRASRCSDGGHAIRAGDVPVPRRADLPVAGTALSLRSAGEHLGHAAGSAAPR